MLKGLYRQYLSPTTHIKTRFEVNSGETARGVRCILTDFRDLENLTFRHVIEVDGKLIENDNIYFDKENRHLDIIFPPLEPGKYKSEIAIICDGKKLLSGIFEVEYLESLLSDDAKTVRLGGYIKDDILDVSNIEAIYSEEKTKLEWRISDDNQPEALSIDSEGNIYVGGANGIKKISKDGNVIEKFNGENIYSIAVDKLGHIYSSDSDGRLSEKHSGGSDWGMKLFSRGIYVITLGKSDIFYCAGGENKIKVVTYGGGELSEINTEFGEIYAIAFDKQENIYYAGDNSFVYKITPSGEEIWKFDCSTRSIASLALDEQENIYIACLDGRIIKLSPEGEKIWENKIHESGVSAVVINDNYLYSAGEDSSIYKISLDGEKIWRFEIPENALSGFYRLIVDKEHNLYAIYGNESVCKISQSKDLLGYKILKDKE